MLEPVPTVRRTPKGTRGLRIYLWFDKGLLFRYLEIRYTVSLIIVAQLVGRIV